jgi:hypothetical protein
MVFQIEEMKKNQRRELTDGYDEQLQSFTGHRRNKTNDSTGWHQLGSLMILKVLLFIMKKR